METIRIAGEPSFRVETEAITFAITQSGGMLAPALFDLGVRLVQPFSIAPWCGTVEAKGLPPILRALRGDFFCIPFGANAAEFEGERHPLHGETANADWRFEGLDDGSDSTTLELTLETSVRPARVKKRISVRKGHPVLYCEHLIEGLKGPVSYGHHAMLQFPEREGSGRVSTSPISRGQVFPGEFENSALGGYSSLLPGAAFESLDRVPLKDGGTADLSRYPARTGFEDLAMVSSVGDGGFAWSAAVFPDEGYVWLSLKNPHTLPSTVLWHSNGGRHYPPWNGRHRGVLGVEEVCANFHYGLAESAAKNPVAEAGIPTCRNFDGSPFSVRYAMAVIPISGDPGPVREVDLQGNGFRVRFESGETRESPLDPDFLAV